MKTYKTIEQALKTNLEAVIINVKENFGNTGQDRIIAKKANGTRTYWLIRHQDGSFSGAI